jgi:RNA recognition motif-containing protein
LTTLFVGNLSPEATDSDLRTVFSVFGEIGSLRVARNRSGHSRGFAFVELEEEAAAAAVEALKGSELKGRTMDVVVDQASSGGRHHKRDARRSGFRRRR